MSENPYRVSHSPVMGRCRGKCGLKDSYGLASGGAGAAIHHRCVLPPGHRGQHSFIGPCGRNR